MVHSTIVMSSTQEYHASTTTLLCNQSTKMAKPSDAVTVLQNHQYSLREKCQESLWWLIVLVVWGQITLCIMCLEHFSLWPADLWENFPLNTSQQTCTISSAGIQRLLTVLWLWMFYKHDSSGKRPAEKTDDGNWIPSRKLMKLSVQADGAFNLGDSWCWTWGNIWRRVMVWTL